MGSVNYIAPNTPVLLIGNTGGGGGGGNISSGPTASLPAPGTAGSVYFPTDGAVIYEDNGTIWQPFGPIQTVFTAPPAVGSLSWVNQATSTAITTHGGIYLSNTSVGGGENVSALVTSAPATPYTFTAFLRGMGGFSNYSMWGLCWRDSGSGSLVLFDCYTGCNLNARKMASPTSFNGDYFTIGTTSQISWSGVWFRLEDDGVNRNFYYSNNGFDFVKVFNTARTDFITPNQIGIFVDCINAGIYTALHVLSWKVN